MSRQYDKVSHKRAHWPKWARLAHLAGQWRAIADTSEKNEKEERARAAQTGIDWGGAHGHGMAAQRASFAASDMHLLAHAFRAGW